MNKITPDDQEIIRKRFPKFSKICACYCNNPAYGVSISPEAQEWLNRHKNGQKQNDKENERMTKLYNPTYNRWEVVTDNPRVVNGEEVAVFVSPDESACDAYLDACDKENQRRDILRYINNHGFIDRARAARIGIMELSSRIGELEETGLVFTRTVVKEYYPDGKYKGWHKEYSL